MLEKKPLFNEQGERNAQRRRMIHGNPTNLIELNNVKYAWAYRLYRTMMQNFWIPEEISLTHDALQYGQLTEAERTAYDRVLSFVIFMDSLQVHNLPNISAVITAPEVNLVLAVQDFQEAVHAQSYAYIVDSVVPQARRDAIYNLWRDDPLLLTRNRFIADQYQQFVALPTEENLLQTLMANFLLEGLYFYSGFAFFYGLGRRGKMGGTVSIIQYINRDELIHLVLFQNILRELFKEEPQLFTLEMREHLRQMTATAVEHETAWSAHVLGKGVAGLTTETVTAYVHYLANDRLHRLGLSPLFPQQTEHPLPWLTRFANLNEQKVDFFEQRVLNYAKASGPQWDEL